MCIFRPQTAEAIYYTFVCLVVIHYAGDPEKFRVTGKRCACARSKSQRSDSEARLCGQHRIDATSNILIRRRSEACVHAPFCSVYHIREHIDSTRSRRHRAAMARRVVMCFSRETQDKKRRDEKTLSLNSFRNTHAYTSAGQETGTRARTVTRHLANN